MTLSSVSTLRQNEINQVTVNVLMAFSGDFPEGVSRNARLKSIGLALQSHNHKAFLLSVRGTRYGLKEGNINPKNGTWNGLPYENVSSPKDFYKSGFHKFYYGVKSLVKSSVILFQKRKKTDVLYLYLPRFSDTLHLLVLSKLLGIKTFVDLTEKLSLKNGSTIHKIEEWLVPKLASHVNCISGPLFEELKNKTQSISKVEVMVDLNRFNNLEHIESHSTIGYLGSFAKKDGIDTILYGFDNFAGHHPNNRLRLIGFDSNPNRTREVIDSLTNADRIDVVGILPYEEIPIKLKECSALVLNRTNEEFAEYGYPIKLGEYLATGIPVLMSDIGGYSHEFIDGESLIKYKPDDTKALSDALTFVFENPDRSSLIGRNGKVLAQQRFDQEKQGARLVAILEQLHAC